MTRHQELIAAGWTRQTTYDEPRLGEVVATYRELGKEVHVEPFVPEDGVDCSVCLRAQPERFFTVYTRSGASRTTRRSP